MAKDMQKIDMAKEFVNLSESDKHYVRKLESMNLKRATNTKAMRSRSRYAGALLGVAVFGIYFYSMYAVKQEKFLDFEEMPPEKNKS